jgi:2-dehydropantoate 2-reductase
MSKTKIIIAGIGGVGGYFGGQLANYYENNENVEIVFFARGEHLRKIQEKGLKVLKGDNEFVAKPFLATDDPAKIGVADLIIICTKSYDLESIVHQLKPCVNGNSMILPLLNGVNSKDRIKNILPDNTVLDGCVYIVARLKEPGVVENKGNIQTLYFGLDNYVDDKLLLIQSLFKEAKIEAVLSKNVSKILWEKFIFLSPIATANSYFDKCFGDILSDVDSLETTKLLIEEVKNVALAKGINIPDDITEKTITKYFSLPYETTTSLHSDFKNNKSKTELEALTGYVIKEGAKLNVKTPTYVTLNTKLESLTV